MTVVADVERLFGRSRRILTVSPGTTVAAAAKVMNEHEVGCLLVIDSASRPVGILTERDILGKVVAQSADAKATRVSNVMTRKVISCAMDTSLDEAECMMGQFGIRHLPILKAGLAKGMISSRDIMAHKLKVAGDLASRQAAVLKELELQYPGITRVEMDSGGSLLL